MKNKNNEIEYGNDTQEDAANNPFLCALRKLIGHDVLLLSWPIFSKGTHKKWKHLTLAEMSNPTYLAELLEGNIGVAMGAVSGGLCSIDLDDDEWMRRFLEVNPRLNGSLRTRGARGCNIWIRLTDGCRTSCKLTTKDGNQVGEFRANGNQTIIQGMHPDTHEPYSYLVEAPPITMDFSQIVWPAGLRVPTSKIVENRVEKSVIGHSNADTQRHSNPATQVTHVVVGCAKKITALPFIPKQRHESDKLLWNMSGALLKYEREQGRQTTYPEKLAIFKEWWQGGKEHLDPSMDEIAYLSKWIKACENRQFADDETPMGRAWEDAQNAARNGLLPPEATAVCDPPMSPKMQLLVALCFYLQKLNGDKPFFLSCRTAGGLLDIPHSTANYWLELLAHEEWPNRVLKKISTGKIETRKANEYNYLPHIKHNENNSPPPNTGSF